MIDEAKALRALGERLKEARKRRGLTQEDLAEQCGFDPTYISLLERGRRNPPFLTLCSLADELGCPLGDLMPAESLSR